MKGHPRTTGARAGFSLLEVAVVLALLSLVMGAIGMAGLSSVRAYRTGTMRVELDVQASRSARRLARELVGSSRQVLLPDPLAPFGTDILDYQQSVGAAAGGGDEEPFAAYGDVEVLSRLDETALLEVDVRGIDNHAGCAFRRQGCLHRRGENRSYGRFAAGPPL